MVNLRLQRDESDRSPGFCGSACPALGQIRWLILVLAVLCLNTACFKVDEDIGKAPKGEAASDSASASLWSEVAPMLTGRNRHASAVLNGKIYVFGGQSATGGRRCSL